MKRYAKQYSNVFPLLIVLLVVSAVISARFGALPIDFATLKNSFLHISQPAESRTLAENVFLSIRLPRVLLCLVVGASLSVSGVLLQALFRNPIVEPGLIGTSSGAAFGAASVFVLGAAFGVNPGSWMLPFAAFSGGAVATVLVYLLAYRRGKQSVTTLLLAGIAVNAVFLSGVGFLAYIARDPQARSIVFWNLGTFAMADWKGVLFTSVTLLLCFGLCLREARMLNALMLGDEEVAYLGVNISRMKFRVLTLNVIMVAMATAFVGVISFVGLVVPHLLRIWKGADNRFLLWGSALLGGVVVVLADLLSRLLLAPAELPVGIVTSLVGAPVFLYLLRRERHYFL